MGHSMIVTFCPADGHDDDGLIGRDLAACEGVNEEMGERPPPLQGYGVGLTSELMNQVITKPNSPSEYLE
jgi:hypothetical protein